MPLEKIVWVLYCVAPAKIRDPNQQEPKIFRRKIYLKMPGHLIFIYQNLAQAV